MHQKNMISIAIIVKNGEKYLQDCLDALRSFDEIILLDNGSVDKTQTIASRFENVKIINHKFIGFGPLKNLAADYTKHDWILSLDCDEILSPELLEEIRGIKLDEKCVYRFSRRSYFNKKWIKGCGWYPDKILRLYNKTRTEFNDNQVHESVLVKPDMQVVDLKGHIKHYPYHNTDELLDKARFYASLYAKQHVGEKRSSPVKAIIRGTAAFLKSYILRRGWLDGFEGFLISYSNGFAAFLKYIFLYEKNQQDKAQSKTSAVEESPEIINPVNEPEA
ncbi:MAG: glycosyltransferase family 2 protein [Nitrospinales bacterium]